MSSGHSLERIEGDRSSGNQAQCGTPHKLNPSVSFLASVSFRFDRKP
jgi:hypothetical protein